MRKVVSDRRASLDEATEIKPAIRKFVEEQFKRGATLPITFFPQDSTTVQDSPRLTLIVLDPDEEWINGNQVVERIGQLTQERGTFATAVPRFVGLVCEEARARTARQG